MIPDTVPTTVRSMTIGGEPVGAEQTFDVMNPATGGSAGSAPECSPAQLDTAFAAAAGAAAAWRAASVADRALVLCEAADRIESAADELADLGAREIGKPRREARAEAVTLAGYLRAFAGRILDDRILVDDASRGVTVRRVPLGVIAVITPWNAPLSTLGMKIAPGLAAGNTVVAKPSPQAPLATLRVGELISSAFPPGVLNVVSGSGELGAWMVAHPCPRKVSFTGSIPVGKTLATTAGLDLKRLTLELGGNDPALVLDDVDVRAVAAPIIQAAFGNAGQICVAIKRLYVVDAVYDRLVEQLAAAAGSLQVGDPFDQGTQMGPLISGEHRERIHALVTGALGDGARLVTGGHQLAGEGFFYAPTVLADVPERSAVVTEEQFGPVLPVIRCADADEAITCANDSMYALGASVWSGDMARARAVAGRIEAGTVWINAHRVTSGFDQPVTGWKWSGLGVEKGTWGMESFTELQTIYEVR